MDILVGILESGWAALRDYLSAHVITCLVPALFIAGAIASFVSQGAILKYFGPKANKLVSYPVAAVSGTVLAVCSCTVLPLFGGIYRRGAGLGPAVAFLYSGPAINILAIVYSANVLGYDIGIARAVGSISFSVVIGLIMALLFHREESQKVSKAFMTTSAGEEGKSIWKQVLFVGILVVILILAASKNWIPMGIAILALLIILWRWFSRDDIMQWLKETAHFTRLVVPWLILGVFLAGLIRYFIPDTFIARYVGGNSFLANFEASFFGVIMYFATLTEVPIVGSFMDLGMGKGPALALLLAGPALSLPSILALRSIMGLKKTLTYTALVTIMAAFTGWIFGFIV
jgi:uncharacterized protein